MNDHSFLLWFNIRTDQLSQILDEVTQSDPTARDLTHTFHLFVATDAKKSLLTPQILNRMSQEDTLQSRLLLAAYMFDLRLRGHPVEALAISQNLNTRRNVIQYFSDTQKCWSQVIAVQHGITAMLAGEFTVALNSFLDARSRTARPGMEFLLRDALLRSALIHAAFGDPHQAHLLLQQSQTINRTSSWVEDGLDASEGLVLALIEPDPEKAHSHLTHINLSQLGEMWPFYVHAEYVLYEKAGARSHSYKKLTQLQALSYPRHDGEGYTGSVLHLLLCSHWLGAGSISTARLHLDRADPKMVTTQLLQALVESQLGDAKKAVQIASALRDQTSELRQLNLWRISIAADAHLARNEIPESIAVLKEAANSFRPLQLSEVNFFSQDLQALGREHVPAWPEGPTVTEGYMDRLPKRERHLSEREQEVLDLLAQGKTRNEIAAALHISINTLKSQLGSIYRKLEASNRPDALRKAAARGLI